MRVTRQQLREAHPAVDYPAHRQAMRSRTAVILCVVLLLITIVSGGLAGYLRRESTRQTELLHSEGVMTMARVDALEIVKDSDTSRERHYVTYTYVSQPGSAQERKSTHEELVGDSLYSQLAVGGGIEVIYARSRPELARITANYQPEELSEAPIFIGVFVVLPSLAGLVWYFVRFRRAARLDRQGTTVMVELLDVYERSVGEGSFYYAAYQLPGGAPFRHRVGPFAYSKLHVGDRVAVRYLPDDPRLFRLLSAKEMSGKTQTEN